jgi:hypothetical protein
VAKPKTNQTRHTFLPRVGLRIDISTPFEWRHSVITEDYYKLQTQLNKYRNSILDCIFQDKRHFNSMKLVMNIDSLREYVRQLRQLEIEGLYGK